MRSACVRALSLWKHKWAATESPRDACAVGLCRKRCPGIPRRSFPPPPYRLGSYDSGACIIRRWDEMTDGCRPGHAIDTSMTTQLVTWRLICRPDDRNPSPAALPTAHSHRICCRYPSPILCATSRLLSVYYDTQTPEGRPHRVPVRVPVMKAR